VIARDADLASDRLCKHISLTTRILLDHSEELLPIASEA
jgi:hypothetical protein